MTNTNLNLICDNCGSADYAVENNFYVCTNCGLQREDIFFDDNTNYIDYSQNYYKFKFKYSRKDYFMVKLKQLQAIENYKINGEILEQIKERFKLNSSKSELLKILKDLKLNKLTVHLNLIFYLLTGSRIYIKPDIENNIVFLFSKYESYFNKYNFRKNCFNISLIIYEFCKYSGLKLDKTSFNLILSKTLRHIVKDNIKGFLNKLEK